MIILLNQYVWSSLKPLLMRPNALREKLELAGTYSLLIDECKDNAGHEELALCFR